ncbi:MAG: hypothetical protein IPK82_33935 [Polyangiaceae bacterium]|nr:hypothetical protein [Polyangiaceae bacterium]
MSAPLSQDLAAKIVDVLTQRGHVLLSKGGRPALVRETAERMNDTLATIMGKLPPPGIVENEVTSTFGDDALDETVEEMVEDVTASLMDADHVEDVFSDDAVIRRDVFRVVKETLLSADRVWAETEEADVEVLLESLGYVAAKAAQRAASHVIESALEKAAKSSQARLQKYSPATKTAVFRAAFATPDGRMELEENIADELANLVEEGKVSLPTLEKRLPLGRATTSAERAAARARLDSAANKLLARSGCTSSWEYVGDSMISLLLVPMSDQDPSAIVPFVEAFGREVLLAFARPTARDTVTSSGLDAWLRLARSEPPPPPKAAAKKPVAEKAPAAEKASVKKEKKEKPPAVAPQKPVEPAAELAPEKDGGERKPGKVGKSAREPKSQAKPASKKNNDGGSDGPTEATLAPLKKKLESADLKPLKKVVEPPVEKPSPKQGLSRVAAEDAPEQAHGSKAAEDARLEKRLAKQAAIEKRLAKQEAAEKKAAEEKAAEKKAARRAQIRRAAQARALAKKLAAERDQGKRPGKQAAAEKRSAKKAAIEKRLAKQAAAEKKAAAKRAASKKAAEKKALAKRAAADRLLQKRLAKQASIEKRLAKQAAAEKNAANRKTLAKKLAAQKKLEKQLAKEKERQRKLAGQAAAAEKALAKKLAAQRAFEKKLAKDAARQKRLAERAQAALRRAQALAKTGVVAAKVPRNKPARKKVVRPRKAAARAKPARNKPVRARAASKKTSRRR